MAVQIVFPDNPNYSGFYTLDGVEYLLNIRYNTRDASWRVSISDSANRPLLIGLKCIPNNRLTFRYTRDGNNLFRGDIFCVDTNRQDEPMPTRTDFGTDKRFQLWYLTEAEVNARYGG